MECCRDRLQNMPNSALPLAINNVKLLLIGPSKTVITYYLGEGTRPWLFAIMVNGHRRVTEPVSLSRDLDLFGDDLLVHH